jgi:L-fuculose-phosphate aldolase
MSYLEEYQDQVNDFVEVCHRLAEHMYATSHGGNMAWKLEENLLLITPTKVHKGDIVEKDLVFIDFDGKTVEGTRKPTGETPMYLNFFRERPDVTTVIHCHPPYTNAFAINKGENWLMRPIFPEATTEIGPVALVPYGEPLTQRLADNFLPYLKKYNSFLMENHGLVIMSRGDIKWTMMLTEMLETTSISILQALQFGEIKEISKEDVQNLDNILQTRNLPLIGLPGENKSLMDLYF